MAELEISIPYRNTLTQVGLGLTVLTFPLWGVLPLMAIFGIGTGALLSALSPLFAHHLGLQFAQLFLCIASISLGLLTLLYFADNRIIIGKEGLCFPRNFLPFIRFKRQRKWSELQSIGFDQMEARTFRIACVRRDPKISAKTKAQASVEPAALSADGFAMPGHRPQSLTLAEAVREKVMRHNDSAQQPSQLSTDQPSQLSTDQPSPPRMIIRNLKLGFAWGTSLTLEAAGMSTDDLNRLVLAIDVWASQYLSDATELDAIKRIARIDATPAALSYTAIWEEELGRRFHSTSYVPLEPGHLLKSGTIKVIRQLSFGGLSAIYLVQHQNKELLVLKEAVIPGYADQNAQSKAMELFQREAVLLTKLDHPDISRVYDHFVEDARHYLLLEYIQGHDLRLFIKHNGPQSESTVLDWTGQIASILSYLHGRQPPIIHRDLTPDNLVLRSSNEVCLIDFGAANEFMSTATGTLIGKQAYIAPEQFRGKAQLLSDIYSLGCTLYFLLTGKDPEPLTVSRPKDAGVAISTELDDLIAACTELDTTARIQTAEDVWQRIQLIKTAVAPRQIAS
ncbi:MAG TPA: serine/threonine-protein kinase [Trichormus sp.]|jgi:tRNA A-37 threonylcarbamoyl transferase component Bud32